MSKGSKPRPFSVSLNEFDENWDMIFGPKKDEPKENNDIFLRRSKEQVDREIVDRDKFDRRIDEEPVEDMNIDK